MWKAKTARRLVQILKKGRIGSTLCILRKIWKPACFVAGTLRADPTETKQDPTEIQQKSNRNQVKKLDTPRGVCYSSKGVKFFG